MKIKTFSGWLDHVEKQVNIFLEKENIEFWDIKLAQNSNIYTIILIYEEHKNSYKYTDKENING